MVSIIIPTYNRSNLLVDAVNSCLNQTYSDIEIIIVDDGSTDRTEKMVSDLMKNEWIEKRIKYYQQNNAGASTARNLGIEHASGEYIQFLDSDDLLHAEKLQRQIYCIKQYNENQPEGCSCYGLLGESFESKNSSRIGISCKVPNEYILHLCGRIVHGMQTSAPLWNSSFIKSQSGWRTDISFGDDLEYHIRLLSKAKNILFVDDQLFLVREHEGERLSVINFDPSKITSSIHTKKAIFKTLNEANLWNKKTQAAFLSSLKTTYANILEIGNREQINDFEKWLLPLTSKPKIYIPFQFLIYCRKYFGKQFILKTHQILMKIR